MTGHDKVGQNSDNDCNKHNSGDVVFLTLSLMSLSPSGRTCTTAHASDVLVYWVYDGTKVCVFHHGGGLAESQPTMAHNILKSGFRQCIARFL